MNFIKKIKEFFKKFKRNRPLLPEENSTTNEDTKESFIKSIDMKG